MSTRYRAKVKRRAQVKKPSPSGARIGKAKILLILVLATALAVGVYVFAAKHRFAPVFHLYWILSTVLLCAALYLDKRNVYLYTKEQAIDPERATAAYGARKKRVKYVILTLLPFLFTVLADTVYLLFFVKD